MNFSSFSHHAGGANTPQPVPPGPFMPSVPTPPTEAWWETPPPEIVEPPLPGHFPLLGAATHWH